MQFPALITISSSESLSVIFIFFSAHILPWVAEDARIEHGVDVGHVLILLFEIGLVDWTTHLEYTTQKQYG